MSFLTWLNEHLPFSRRRPHLHEAMRVSEELADTKRMLTRFARDRESGKVGHVVRIREHIVEQLYLPPKQERDR